MAEAKAPKSSITPHSGWLVSHRGGALDAEITAKMVELVSAVTYIGKKGTITIQIEVKPGAKGADYLHVVDHVKVVLPEYDREEKVYWADPDTFELVRHDPQNARMFPDDKPSE